VVVGNGWVAALNKKAGRSSLWHCEVGYLASGRARGSELFLLFLSSGAPGDLYFCVGDGIDQWTIIFFFLPRFETRVLSVTFVLLALFNGKEEL
jgi:hypothetical protein